MSQLLLNPNTDMLLKPEGIHIKAINAALKDMKQNVFVIGEHLLKLKTDIENMDRDYTIFDVADELFNIKKSTVYNYINIYKRFNSDDYQNYSLSLLTEFLTLDEAEEEYFDQFSTVQDVRAYKNQAQQLPNKSDPVKEKQEVKKQDAPAPSDDTDIIDVESLEIKEPSIGIDDELKLLQSYIRGIEFGVNDADLAHVERQQKYAAKQIETILKAATTESPVQKGKTQKDYDKLEKAHEKTTCDLVQSLKRTQDLEHYIEINNIAFRYNLPEVFHFIKFMISDLECAGDYTFRRIQDNIDLIVESKICKDYENYADEE